jgi:hypothetical protein
MNVKICVKMSKNKQLERLDNTGKNWTKANIAYEIKCRNNADMETENSQSSMETENIESSDEFINRDPDSEWQDYAKTADDF